MTPTRMVVVASAFYKKKMTEDEFQHRLKEMGLTAEKFDNPPHGKSIRFVHPIAGVVTEGSYSQEAIDDMKRIHNIDGNANVRAAVIKTLEEHWALTALKILESGDADAFFKQFNFGHLEELAEKYPGVAKLVADPKWRPK